MNASMKVPPKRKGNISWNVRGEYKPFSLNESPSEKEGKLAPVFTWLYENISLNESPSEKEGKSGKGFQS